MIIVSTTANVLPEKRENFLALLPSLIQSSQNDEGCISYQVFEELSNPNSFHFFGKWATQEDIDAHLQAVHTKSFLDIVPSLVSKEPIMKFYKVEGIKSA